MKQLIIDSKFEDLKEYLNRSNSIIGIHKVLLKILDGRNIVLDGKTFDANKYQEDFLEGLDIYRSLEKSEFPKTQFKEYIKVLSFLAYQMDSFLKLLVDRFMPDEIYLAQIDGYKIDPFTLREELQCFVNLLKNRNEIKAAANVAAAKVHITLCMMEVLKRHEIGEDLLQSAMTYEEVGQLEKAVNTYQVIINYFECESFKASSLMLPEISHVDTRSSKEIEIFETARNRYKAITNIGFFTRLKNLFKKS